MWYSACCGGDIAPKAELVICILSGFRGNTYARSHTTYRLPASFARLIHCAYRPLLGRILACDGPAHEQLRFCFKLPCSWRRLVIQSAVDCFQPDRALCRCDDTLRRYTGNSRRHRLTQVQAMGAQTRHCRFNRGYCTLIPPLSVTGHIRIGNPYKERNNNYGLVMIDPSILIKTRAR